MDIGKEQHLKKKTYQVTLPVSRMFGMEYSDLEALQLTYFKKRSKWYFFQIKL